VYPGDVHPVEGRILFEGRTLKRGGGGWIRVTTRCCMVNGYRYPIEELDVLGVSRGPRSVLRARSVTVAVAVLVGLVLLVYAIAVGWTRNLWVALAFTVLGTVAVTAIPAAVIGVMRRPYEIWAEHRGRLVLLFGTYNQERYGQVARALIRAREATE
jgi:hypothetical protein